MTDQQRKKLNLFIETVFSKRYFYKDYIYKIIDKMGLQVINIHKKLQFNSIQFKSIFKMLFR